LKERKVKGGEKKGFKKSPVRHIGTKKGKEKKKNALVRRRKRNPKGRTPFQTSRKPTEDPREGVRTP